MPKTTATTGTVVEEFMLGNTRIKICNDAYINKTPEEIDQILKRVNNIALKCVMSSDYKDNSRGEKQKEEDSGSDHHHSA